jgi:predicted phosphodiesterase
VRLLLLSDQAHPHIYSPRFPENLPPFDLVLAAGDLPGAYLEYVATKVRVPVLFVPGNHGSSTASSAPGSTSTATPPSSGPTPSGATAPSWG